MPPAPKLPGEEPEPVAPPKPVEVSFWLWVTSGVVFIVGYAIIFFARDRIIDSVIKGNTSSAVNPDQIRSGTTVLLAVLLVGAVSFAAMYVLFAYKARQGTRSARTVLVFLMAITVLFQVALPFSSLVTLVATLVGLIALALLFLPKVTAYFPKVGRAKP
ncbi:hypothetical protein FG385_04670 [Amycolatopsis alkalitolerans]|uniref:Uncharacterized protein n=1 Tax=Amycolatopsis alkalitolerans TaxID=2547244 RepID=A0A5C4M6M0_9PSEU|nr:hypothetical protein FG385_04670 [Amycolatopsis alkalitolerans]